MASFVWLNLEEHMFAYFVTTNNIYIYSEYTNIEVKYLTV
jgi:hypothetical protein